MILFFTSCKKEKNIDETNKSINENFEVVNSYPHDINSFTEGLFFYDGILYESTGSPKELTNTESVIGILNLKTGLIDVKSKLDKNIYFGEGITKCGDKLYQLTYKNRIGFIYDFKTFKLIDKFNYPNEEGWGLTSNKDTLIMSDGTNKLSYIDSNNFNLVRKVTVQKYGEPLNNLNELEFVKGNVYSNIYMTNYIIKIDNKSGKVMQTYDMLKLFHESKNYNNLSLEMNGIAYNPVNDTFFVTGKMWPRIYEVRLFD